MFSRWVIFALCVVWLGPQAWANRDQELRDRLNKILYWQLADELKLTPQVEKEMILTLEDLQSRREKALAVRSQALSELKQVEAAQKSGTRKDADLSRDRAEGLKKLNGALQELGLLDAQEFERLSKILGPETLSRFFVVREALAARVREAIRNPSR